MIRENLEFRPDDELEAQSARREMRAHDTGERAFVRERERRIAECVRPLNQLLRMRGPAQEREVREAVELGVGNRCAIMRHAAISHGFRHTQQYIGA